MQVNNEDGIIAKSSEKSQEIQNQLSGENANNETIKQIENVDKVQSTIDFNAVKLRYKQIDEIERHNLYKSENVGKKNTLFKVGIIYFAIVALLIGIRIASNYGVFDGFGLIGKTTVTSAIIQIIVMFAIPVVFFTLAKKQKTKDTFKDFQYKKVSGKVIACAIALGFIVFFLNGYISSLFAYIIELLGYETVPTSGTSTGNDYTWVYFIVSVICSCLLPAICEETAHRGMLLTGLKRYGVGKAIIISGLLFGLIHLNINQFFYATIIGWLLGALTIMSNSIYPAMIVHFMNNFLSTCAEFSLANGLNYLNPNILLNAILSLFGGVFGNLVLFLFIVGLVWLGIYLMTKIYKAQKLPYVKKRIIKDNLHFFLSSDNLEINDKNLNDVYFKRFFGNENISNASLMYLMDKSKQKGFWDNLEDTYLPKDKNGLMDYIFIVGAIVLGAVTTLFTFIWGLL